MIIAGAIVFYVTVILFGVDENITSFSVVDGLCHARVWLCVIGFSFLYGTIFAKALRIYYIFSHLKPNSKVVCNIAGNLFQKWTVIVHFTLPIVLPILVCGSTTLVHGQKVALPQTKMGEKFRNFLHPKKSILK